MKISTINKIIQSNSETGDGSGLRFIPAQWDETGETVGYDATTISDTIDDALGFTVKIRQVSSENAYDELSWTVQVNSTRSESPEIPCDSLIEAYKTTMMWYTGFCEGRVIQSELDAVNTHMMLENDVNLDFLGIDEDSMNDCVEVGDTLNSKSNNSTIINDEFPNSNTEGNVTPKKHSIRGLMGWLAGLIY